MHSCRRIYPAIKNPCRRWAYMIITFQPARQGNEHCGLVLEQSRGIEKRKKPD
jgi:hypothetical protein